MHLYKMPGIFFLFAAMKTNRTLKMLFVALLALAPCGCDRKPAIEADTTNEKQKTVSHQPSAPLITVNKGQSNSKVAAELNRADDSIESMSTIVKQTRTGVRSREAVVAMHKLLSSWEPIGKSTSDIKAMLGTPSEEKPDAIIYRIDTGDSNYEWSIAISGGIASSMKKNVSE